MKRAGCSRIYFGLESGAQEILNDIHKGITLKQIKDTIGLCKDLEIKTLGFFLIGSPGETKETIKKTLHFAKSLNLDYVQFSKCLAKPLTPLWKELICVTGKDYWQEWILNKEIDRELPRPWTTLTDREIDRVTKWAYVFYYSRPRYLIKRILQFHSWAEFRRKFHAYVDMLFLQESYAKEDKDFIAFNENKIFLKKYKRLNHPFVKTEE